MMMEAAARALAWRAQAISLIVSVAGVVITGADKRYSYCDLIALYKSPILLPNTSVIRFLCDRSGRD